MGEGTKRSELTALQRQGLERLEACARIRDHNRCLCSAGDPAAPSANGRIRPIWSAILPVESTLGHSKHFGILSGTPDRDTWFPFIVRIRCLECAKNSKSVPSARLEVASPQH